MATSDEESVLFEYKSSLSDLDFNSKPMINMLTMLAEENVSYASGIVSIIKMRIIESNIKLKLPSLYLLDSILKNVGENFIQAITDNLLEIFLNVFEHGDERVRISLYKLRNTWRDFFTKEFLYELDLAVKNLDQNWPVVDVPPPSSSIHINPRFLVKNERGPSIEYDLQHGNTNSIGHAERNISTQQQETKDQPLVGGKVSQGSAKYSKVPRSTDPRTKDPRAKDPPAKDLLQSDSNFIDGSSARGNQHEVMPRKKNSDELLLTGSKAAKEVLPKGSSVSNNVKRQRTTKLSPEVTEGNMSLTNADANDRIFSSVSNIDSSVMYKGEAAGNSLIQLQSNITKGSNGEWFPPNKKVKILRNQRVSSNGSDCRNEIGNLDGNVSKIVREATAEMSERQNTTGGHLAEHSFPIEAEHHRNGSNMKRKSNLDGGQRVPSEDELPRQMRIKNHQKLLDELRKRLDIGEITKDAHDALLGQINMMYQVQKRRDSTGESPHGERVGEAIPSVSSIIDGSLKEASPGQKSLEQKKTNRDLIAQLKEKRLNVVKELTENATKNEPLVSLKQDSKMATTEKISELPDVTSGKSNTNDDFAKNVTGSKRISQASTHKTNTNIEAIEKSNRLVAEPCSKSLIATEQPCLSQQVTNLGRDSNFDVLRNKPEVHGRAFKTERKVNKRNFFNFHEQKHNSVNAEREEVQHNKLLHKKDREGFGIRHQGSKVSLVNFNEMSQPSSDLDVESRAKKRHENLYWGDEVSKRLPGPSSSSFAPRNSCEWQRAPFDNRRPIGPRPPVQLFEQKLHYDNSRHHREQETFLREDRFRRDNFRERNQAENDRFFDDEVRNVSEKVQGRFVAPGASRHQQSQFKGFARGGRQRFVHRIPSSPYFRPNTQDNRMLPDSFQDQPFRRNLPDFDAPGRNIEDSWVMDSKFDNKRVSGAAGPNIGDDHPHRRQMLDSRRDVEAPRHVDFIRHEEAFRQSRADNIAHHPFREDRFIYNNEPGFFKSAQPVPENMSMKPDLQTQSVDTHHEQLPFRSLRPDESTSAGISADQRLRYLNSNEDDKRHLEENDNIHSRTRQMSLFEKSVNTDKSNVAEEFEPRTGLDNSSRYKTFNTSETKADEEIPSEKRKFIGVRELFQRLVSSGVIANSSKQVEEKRASTPPPALESEEAIIPNLRFVMEDLKTRHGSVIDRLYTGTQCASCGLRFFGDNKILYSDHLDWHFRNNSRGKEVKKSSSRTWFCFLEQWVDMDDVKDIDEQEKGNVFEMEKKSEGQASSARESSCSVLTDDEACQVCLEELEQFWDESLEEWRYKNATRIKGRTYHVSCYDGADVGSVIEMEDCCPLPQHKTIITNEENLSHFLDADERLEEQKTEQNLSSLLLNSSKHDEVLLQNGTETSHSSSDTAAQICQVNQDSDSN